MPPPPPPGSSPSQSAGPTNPSASASGSPSPTDNHTQGHEHEASVRLSRDSEGYPTWLPKRPPPPAPASTLQSSILGGMRDSPPTPTEAGMQFGQYGGRKPTPRSVRIVSLQDEFADVVDKDAAGLAREPTDQTRIGAAVHAPPKVWTRASGAPPSQFNASEHDEFLPLPQPRFNAKNLHLQILRNPSRWMKTYYYVWPLLVYYHIPLQTFFDFNAVFILLQVAKYPDPGTSGKNWALGAAAYIACWFAWIIVVCITYELIYSFARRWRLRRPLMLPIYLSAPAFNLVAMTSYTNFSFLQHLRFSAFLSEHAIAIAPQSPSIPSYPDDDTEDPSDVMGSWKQGLAETCFFYSQNLPTLGLLLPRAGLSLALLLAFSTPAELFVASGQPNTRDATFFSADGALTDYAKGVLIANIAWTAWRTLVLIMSWLGLWIFSNQRLGGLCGPRHVWDEHEQEKTRSVYSEAASEYGAYRASFYHGDGEGDASYGGDELPWEWRENTRMRVQDAFEFCLNTKKRRSEGAAGLRWSVGSGYPHEYRSRRYRRHHGRSRSGKGKEPSKEKAEDEEEPFDGIEKVLAAAGFPSAASPARRPLLTKDLFAGPLSVIPISPEALPSGEQQAGPSYSAVVLEAPKTAKRNSKDRITTAAPGAPLMSLPYPFSRPGAGQVSSNDLVPFPGTSQETRQNGSEKAKSTKGSSSKSTASSSGQTSTESGSGTGSGSGTTEEGEEEGDEEEEEEEGDDEEEEADDDDEVDEEFDGSEDPSSGRGSESMSSLGQPISPSRHHLGTRRVRGHTRNISGVSSGLSGPSSGSHAHSHSISSSMGTRSGGGMSVLTQSTGNRESTDSESPLQRQRASLSQGSSVSPSIPMPPRHPHPQGQGRGRAVISHSTSSSSSAAAAAALASLNIYSNQVVAFPTSTSSRRRADSGPARSGQQEMLYEDSDLEGQIEFNEEDLEVEDDDDEEEEEDENGEHADRVGLLVPSPRVSLVGGSSRANSFSSVNNEARSRTHSLHSGSRSRHSSTRTRTHSSHSPSVRERANSVGNSVRSLMLGARASLTQLDAIMRGATGPAAGLGSRPRSRVNSSMARLEEDVVYSPSATELGERIRNSRVVSSNSDSSGGSAVGPVADPVRRVAMELETEDYSSAGSHSRSGSESVATENHTFGQPLLFMRPNPEQQQPPVTVEADDDNDDEILLIERTGNSARNSALNSARNSAHNSVQNLGGMSSHRNLPALADNLGEPQSLSSASFYSAQPSARSASPARTVLSQKSATPERSLERQGVDIPGRGRQHLAPPSHHWMSPTRQIGAGLATLGSGSQPDISTAAASFVTAPVSMEGTVTPTEDIGRQTLSSSWDSAAPAIGMHLRGMGGMVERPGDDMGAGSWRVV